LPVVLPGMNPGPGCSVLYLADSAEIKKGELRKAPPFYLTFEIYLEKSLVNSGISIKRKLRRQPVSGGC